MPGVIVDIGTGDGSFVYELAKNHPDKMVIGIDPNHKGMVDTSRKTLKKPEKGGVKNALFVLAAVDALPDELAGKANQVYINFPWGTLLSGLVLGDEQTWKNIKKICQDKAVIDIILGYDKSLEIKKVNENLPVLDKKYFSSVLRSKIKNLGLELTEIKPLSSRILKSYPSTWAKKLSFAQERDFYYLRLFA